MEASERPIRTFSSQLVWLLLLSTGLVAEGACGILQYISYRNGTTWSPDVFFGIGREIRRSSEPHLFWNLWFVYSAIHCGMVALILNLIGLIVTEDRRRQSDIRSKIALWGCGTIYLATLSGAVLYVAYGLE